LTQIGLEIEVIGETLIVMFSNVTMLQFPAAPKSNQLQRYLLVKLIILQALLQFGLIH
jgi:hypothetical protein